VGHSHARKEGKKKFQQKKNTGFKTISPRGLVNIEQKAERRGVWGDKMEGRDRDPRRVLPKKGPVFGREKGLQHMEGGPAPQGAERGNKKKKKKQKRTTEGQKMGVLKRSGELKSRKKRNPDVRHPKPRSTNVSKSMKEKDGGMKAKRKATKKDKKRALGPLRNSWCQFEKQTSRVD